MPQTEQRCQNGHFYNPAKFSSCPHCGVAGIDLGPTRPVSNPPMPVGAGGGNPGAPIGQTVPLNRAGGNAGEQATRAWYPSQADEKGGEKPVDPIVGWLVCIEGPDRGRDFRIKAEKNFVGRATTMDICIAGDPRISRENHAIIAFEPRSAEFRLYSGDARGLVYLNRSMVDVPVVLRPFDMIELGDSKLLFVPFCGERFRWPEKL
jgi:hypothetical protein